MNPKKNRLSLKISLALCVALSSLACGFGEGARLRHVERGENLLNERRYLDASLEFRSALEADKNFAPALWGLVRATEAQNQPYETLELLKQLIKTAPDHLEARVKFANYLIAANPPQLGEAENQLREIFARNPNFVDGHILQASLFAARQKPEREIVQSLEKAISLDEKRVESYLALARFYSNIKKTAEAENTYRRALNVNENAGIIYAEMGTFLASAQRFDEAEAKFRRAVELEPRSGEFYETLAQFYIAQKRLNDAENVFQNLIKAEPERPETAARLAEFYAANGRQNDALRVYGEITAKNPQFAQGRARLGELLLDKGDLEGAKTQIAELFSRNKRDSKAFLLQGRAHLFEGKPEEAVKDFEQILKISPTSAEALAAMAEARMKSGETQQAQAFINDLARYHPQSPQPKILSVQLALRENDFRRAADEATAALAALNASENQARVNLLQNRGAARLGLKDAARSTEDFRSALQIAPDNSHIHLNLAQIALSANRFQDAIAGFEKTLSLDGANFDAARGLTNALRAAGSADAARRKIDELLTANADNKSFGAALNLLRGEHALADGDASTAEKSFAQAIALNPNYLAAYAAQASLLVGRGDVGGAIEKYRQITKLRPNDDGSFALLGILEEQRGDISAAKDCYRQAVTLNPQNFIAANNLAWIYAEYDTANLDDALQMAQKVVEKYPNEAVFADTFGWVLHKKGLNDAAAVQLRKAVALDSSRNLSADNSSPNPAYRLRLGEILAALGDKQNARREIEAALRDEKSLTPAEIEKLRQLLGSLTADLR